MRKNRKYSKAECLSYLEEYMCSSQNHSEFEREKGLKRHLVEHLTLNQGVRGSSPRRPTCKSIGFAEEAAESVFFFVDTGESDSASV